MRSINASVLSIALCAACLLGAGLAPAGEVVLEDTFYYSGDMNATHWQPSAIDVDADGTVAITCNRSKGPFNFPSVEQERALILLYDKAGEPIGRIANFPSSMADVAFGPDGRLYTAEGWFKAGSHVHDRPGCKDRYVAIRDFNADGSHVDKGAPHAIGIGPDYTMYTLLHDKLHAISPDNKLIKSVPLAGGHRKLDVGRDGTIYWGNKMLQADGTWKDLPFTVRDVAPDGTLLAQNGGWSIRDPKTSAVLLKVTLPPGAWGDAALGPDGNIYLAPQNDPGLGYAVSSPAGEIILTRGADYDRLKVTLPDSTLTAGEETPIKVELARSRDQGCVPASQILPQDERPELKLTASVIPVKGDPLVEQSSEACYVKQLGPGVCTLTPQTKMFGKYKLTLRATPYLKGARGLEVVTPVSIWPADVRAWLEASTDRDRAGFPAGSDIRVAVAVNAMKDVDLSKAVLRLTPLFSVQPKAAWERSLGLEAVTAGSNPTAVVMIPGDVTRALRSGMYILQAAAPQIVGVAGNEFRIELTSPARRTDFETVLHPIFTGSFTVPNAKLPAQFNATHVAAGMFPQEEQTNLPSYVDVAARLGFTFQWQPHGHFAAINSLPQEQGATKQWLAAAAQKYQTFPAFRGFNYHDLIAPFKTWWDNVRKDHYDAIWDAAGKDVAISAGVPADKQEEYRRLVGQSFMLPSVYAGWNSAIKHAVPRLEQATMGWINANLTFFDPDKVAPLFDVVATQHMEEQFYHPVTVANQADLWRTAGKPLWNYGNCIFQDDGTGAEMYRELMAGLMRGVQGIGRNFIPQHGVPRCELVERCVAPAFGLFQVYGGLSAASEPDDHVAIWRSISQEALNSGSPSHAAAKYVQYCNTLAAYTACLYAHRPATIVTDGKVLAGELRKYKVAIVNFEIEPTPDLVAKLKEFQDAGGLVLANKHLQSSWIPPGAVDLGPLFQDSHAYVHHNEDVDRWFDMEQEEGGRVAKALLAALGDKVKPIVDCDDPTTWLSVLKHGDARFVFTTSVKLVPMRPEDLHRYSAYQNTAMPSVSTLRFVPGDYVIYDMFDGKLVKPNVGAAPRGRPGQAQGPAPTKEWQVECDMRLFPGRIFALLPKEIKEVRLAAGSANGELTLQASVVDDDGRAINAACPLSVTLRQGRYTIGPLHRTARGGVWQETLSMPHDANMSAWSVEVTELLSGSKVTARVDVKVDPPAAAEPVSAVEWYRTGDARRLLEKAKTADALPAALIIEDKQREPLADAIAAAHKSFQSSGTEFVEVSARNYLADKQALGWDKFKFGEGFNPEIKLREPKYSMIVALDTPALPSGVIPLASLPVRPTATDPGPGRGLVQFIASPVYDGEDAISICGGDPAGVLAAAVADQPAGAAPSSRPGQAQGPAPTQVKGAASREKLPGLSGHFGAPAAEVAVSPDGSRIAVGLKAWGNNVFVLDARNGKVLGKDVAGKFFPMNLRALDSGFAVISHEIDPTCLYLKVYDRSGKPTVRIAAPGRRIGGCGAVSPSHPETIANSLRQASFSITPDGRYAAAGGSKGIAVWDVSARKLLWRDDSACYGPDGDFPQVMIASDASSVAVQYNGKIALRDAKTGKPAGEVQLPLGASLGRARQFDGTTLIVGDNELFAIQVRPKIEKKPLWWWKIPATDLASISFAPSGGADPLNFAVGQYDGTVRLMRGSRQVLGSVAQSGGALSVDVSRDGSRFAYVSTTGEAESMSRGKGAWVMNIKHRGAIAFIGNDGDTVIADWLGVVRRLDAKAKEAWRIDLTPQVWRDDIDKILTTLDATPTLRLEAPARDGAPMAGKNLAPDASVALTQARTIGWERPIATLKDGGAVLNNGKADDAERPWFDRDGANYMVGSEYKKPLTWELTWKEPVKLDVLVVRESAAHPESVPEEIAIDAWIEEGDWKGWKRLVHDRWNSGTVHAHPFPAATTKQLRYIVYGDFANNLWTAEIEAYGP